MKSNEPLSKQLTSNRKKQFKKCFADNMNDRALGQT